MKKIIYDEDYLKELLFDLFDRYNDYDFIIRDLRSLCSFGEITEEEYNYILKKYDKWLKEYEKKGDE